MDHMTCDICGRLLLIESEVRYEVAIEVKAAYDPMEISQDDLNKDFRAEIAKLLRQMEGLSAEEAQDQVYRTFEFDMCTACQRQYIQNPLKSHKERLKSHKER